jgi:hypothetical protein
MQPITSNENTTILSSPSSFMSSNAIIAGVLVALIIGLLLNLLGTGIGFFVFSPKAAVIKPLGIATFIWFMLSGIVSLYIGGWVSGRAGYAQSTLGASIYGMIVASISTLTSLILMLTVAGALFTSSLSILGNVISFSKSTIGSSASLMDKGLEGMKNVAPGLSSKIKEMIPDLQPVVDEINKKADALLPKEGEKRQEVKKQLQKVIRVYLDSDDMTYEEAKSELTNSLVEITGARPEKINEMVDEWYKTYQEAKEKVAQIAEDAANKTASVLSQMAWMNFFILLTTLSAAIIGAVHGVDSRYREGAL